jgi:acetolactate synthase-1/3 small subunit
MQKQVHKIIDTVKVTPIDEFNKVEREIALIKIKTTKIESFEIIQLINAYKGKIVDSTLGGMIVEIVGRKKKIEGFISFIPKNNVLDIARTGIIAMNQFGY